MMKQNDYENILLEFINHLQSEEKCPLTIEKYKRDVRRFITFTEGKAVEKTVVISFKELLISQGYAIRSVNSMLASVNAFLQFIGRSDCRVKSLKLQKRAYLSEDKELTKNEYRRLVYSSKNNEQLNLIIQTICATGIRVSELKYITVEAVKKGEAVVNCKAKNRIIIIPGDLKHILMKYINKKRMTTGAVFVTKTGKPLDRSYIWLQMKKLCKKAGVLASKVFPHNLRKLFARSFYEKEKDIAKLADVLGHSNIETTRIYIMTTGVEHRRKIEMLRLVV